MTTTWGTTGTIYKQEHQCEQASSFQSSSIILIDVFVCMQQEAATELFFFLKKIYHTDLQLIYVLKRQHGNYKRYSTGLLVLLNTLTKEISCISHKTEGDFSVSEP